MVYHSLLMWDVCFLADWLDFQPPMDAGVPDVHAPFYELVPFQEVQGITNLVQHERASRTHRFLVPLDEILLRHLVVRKLLKRIDQIALNFRKDVFHVVGVSWKVVFRR
jgi:hypothetical protein